MDSQGDHMGGRVRTTGSGVIAEADRNIASVFDEVAPMAPCYRRGAVIRALSVSPEGRHPIRRNAFEARRLGLALVNQASSIDKAVAAALRAVGAEIGLPLKSVELLGVDVRSRFAPGLILDFPQHEFSLGSMVVRERTCVTVCYNESASKIWTRFVVRDGEKRLTAVQLSDFYRFCDQASQASIEAIRTIYLDAFKADLPRSTKVDFEEIGQIDFVGFDTEYLDFGDYLYIDEVGIVADASDISESRREIFVRFFREHLDFLFPSRFKDSEIKKIADDRVSVFRSEFSYRALYHGIFRDRAVTFLVMSEPGERVTDAPYQRESGALTVISELAARAMTDF